MEHENYQSRPMIAPPGFTPKKIYGTAEYRSIHRLVEEAEVYHSRHRCRFVFKIRNNESPDP